MKTSSILMSSFVALLILISVSENALKKTREISKPNQTSSEVQQVVLANEISLAKAIRHISKTTNDFSYLKFNVSEFETTEVSNDEMPVEADFNYLKFKVSDFIETGTDIETLSKDSDFGYLKFDVNTYTTNPNNEEDIPSADLDYLKFDVQKFMPYNSAGDISELPDEGNR